MTLNLLLWNKCSIFTGILSISNRFLKPLNFFFVFADFFPQNILIFQEIIQQERVVWIFWRWAEKGTLTGRFSRPGIIRLTSFLCTFKDYSVFKSIPSISYWSLSKRPQNRLNKILRVNFQIRDLSRSSFWTRRPTRTSSFSWEQERARHSLPCCFWRSTLCSCCLTSTKAEREPSSLLIKVSFIGKN